MDNFHDSTIMASAQTQLTLVKFWHVTGGLYLWEFLTTIDYEWGVIRGDLPYQWTIWVYSFARVSALVGLIVSLASMDVTTPINCQLWVLFSIIVFCMCSTAASLLIVLRTIAIWNRNKAIVTLTITIWGVSLALHLQNITRVHFAWNSTQLACVPVEAHFSVLGFIPMILSDLTLFLITLAGLLNLRCRPGGGTLARLLWKQGVVWLALGSVAEVLPLVFILWHLNVQLGGMFLAPLVTIMTITTTRMHRSLVDFASGPSDVTNESPQLTSLVLSRARRTDTAPTALNRVEVSMHSTSPAVSGEGTPTTISTTSCHLSTVSSSPIPGAQSV